ncbi:NACHT and WD40 domain protein [Aspergillus affinis]|uniref:NACHT and WD40 domain protein n=1 Tax=Aspergillus affinis TaxID=1070780 RepID=UPI0022FF2C76|nr:NACHT and WD40 domain protein [Aspergillus affinis]KAI9035476.1 NACHT and WD40 domain protein [Aspergillus affinis]
MADSKSTRLKRWFRQTLGSQDNTFIPHQTDNCVHHPSVSECASAALAGESQSQPQNPSSPQDLWKSAFDQLLAEEKKALRTSVVSSTTDAINNVIETTKEKYEEYQEKGGIRIRKSTGEEVNIRKMAKNHYDRRDALFESSEYLAEALARCAYIEQKICHNRPDGDDLVTQAIITLYRTILQYAAKVMASHNMSTGGKLLDSVTATTAQYITEFRYSIEKEEQKLFHFAQLQTIEEIERITAFTQTQNEKATEEILTAIDDKLSKSLNALNLRFSLPIAANAFWNSYQHEDLCHEDTRVQTRSQIAQWADSVENECIFWLNGGAGTGKSTIARTVAQAFEAKGQLGASFFFKRNEPDRGNARRLIPTITKELIKQNKDLASGVLKAIEHDPQIAAKDVTEQFNKLLLEPLKNVAMYPSRTLVIVIDALDECENNKEIGTILQFLPRVREPSSMRLKIFLTSRPELPLRRFFEKESSHQGLILERIAEEAIKEDIMRFLEHRFAEIGRQANTGKDWPGDEVLEALATACMPLFISAATICRFIEQSGEDPVERLADILNDQRRYVTKMDKTYGPILDRILRERDEDEQEKQVTRFKRIFGVIILLSVPLPINALSEFVGISARSVEFLLDSFHSVLRIPDEQDLPVRILHLSFREYLLTTQSCFHSENNSEYSEFLTDAHRFILQNIQMANGAPLQLYASGLVFTPTSSLVRQIFGKQYSPWIRALPRMHKSWGANRQTLEGHSCSVQAVAFSSDGRTIASGSTDKTIKLWNAETGEQRRTLEGHSNLIWAVAFSPDGRTIASGSNDKTIKLWNTATGKQRQTLEGRLRLVWAVTFSPDGRTIASGSTDFTIKLWNTATGEQRQTLKGHSSAVQAVAFSPDGQTIASGSYDKTIMLWYAETGEQ